jgi:hypothetical protein
MIANAPSPAEIERIEECVKRGEFPDKTSDDNSNGNVEKENGNGEKVSKKQRTS